MPFIETLIFLFLAYTAAFALDRRYGHAPGNVPAAKTEDLPAKTTAKKCTRQRIIQKPVVVETGQPLDNDAVTALRSLGYSKREAVFAIKGVQEKHEIFGTAELVKAALRQAAGHG